MRGRLYSTSVVIVTINGRTDYATDIQPKFEQWTISISTISIALGVLGFLRYDSRVFLVHLKRSPHTRFNNLNPRGNLIRIYKHVCFGFFKNFLATTNSPSVSTSFSSCITLRSALTFRYHTNMALACLFKYFGTAVYDCVSNQK